jgi:Rrf2 family transcriptional regulator, iron-sulfur cluster assembly transcription factor
MENGATMISLTGEYALRAMVYLARHSTEWPISGPRIAEGAGIPRNYLSAILSDLVRAGLLEGMRGKSGGFRLTRPVKRIRLAEIVRSFEPVNSQRRTCPFGNTVCSDVDPCGAHERWKGVKAALEEFLEETTLDAVAGKGNGVVTIERKP